jgi:16S rRNA (guanine966-N2)-methyltransferase
MRAHHEDASIVPHPEANAARASERQDKGRKMRVTSGKFGGRTLAAPADMRVRPTSDKVRQAIFNILEHRDFANGFALDDAAVIDLFAGTGALGIEALSRGARFCLFVDEDADSRGLQRRNVEALGLTGVTKIWRRDAGDLGPLNTGSGGPFNLAFLDPPYRKGLADKCLASLKAGGWLADDAVIVVETAIDETLAAPGFTLRDTRDYGETRATFLVTAA